MNLEPKPKRIFDIAGPGKKVSFSYRNFQLFRINCNYRTSKIGLFRRVKELSKTNQTRYGVSPVYLDSKTKRVFALACTGKS